VCRRNATVLDMLVSAYLQHGPHMLRVAGTVPHVAAGCCTHHLTLRQLLQVTPAANKVQHSTANRRMFNIFQEICQGTHEMMQG
jgi:hypothetical protein